MRPFFSLAVVVLACNSTVAAPPVVGPSEAAKKVGETVTLEMTVQSVGHSKGAHFLNSERDYRSADSFTLFIGRSAAAKFRQAGAADPTARFNGKRVRVTGTVQLYRGRPEIVIEDPAMIELIER